MSSGGSRSRSGPPVDPKSLRSGQRGIRLTPLPSGGHSGDAPALENFLLVVSERHRTIWEQLWSTPQAAAWALEPWRWPIVADLVEMRVRVDDPDCPAQLVSSVRQLRDDLGLSAAGLRANGWAIADDEVSAKREDRPKRASARDRLKVVDGAWKGSISSDA